MNSVKLSFYQMIGQMKNDIMLFMIILAPFLTGLFFRIAVPPLAETFEIIKGYYPLFDAVLIIMTPVMFNFAAAMVLLDEIDSRISTYMAVTPLGKTGYLFSRLGLINLAAFVLSIIVVFIFRISNMNMLFFAAVAAAGSAQGLVSALLIVALSKNKVEGMAVGKFASLMNLGIIGSYFVNGEARLFLFPLPSFWIGETVRTERFLPLLVCIPLAFIWVAFLSGKFLKKISG